MKGDKEIFISMFAGLIIAVVAISVAIGAYQLNRWINWKFGYQHMVKEQIHLMVKPEALK